MYDQTLENDIIVELSKSQPQSRPMYQFKLTWKNKNIDYELTSFSISNAFLEFHNKAKINGYNLLSYYYREVTFYHQLSINKIVINMLNCLRNSSYKVSMKVLNPNTRKWVKINNPNMTKLIPDY